MDTQHDFRQSLELAIRKLNVNTYNKIKSMDEALSVSMLQKILDELSSPKKEEPLKLQLKKDKSKAIPAGVYNIFKLNYTATAPADPEEIQGYLKIKGTNIKVRCDIEVIRTCKSVLLTGKSFDIDLAETCQSIFKRIIVLGSTGDITKGAMLAVLEETKTYYEKELLTAIKECVGDM